MEVTNLKKFDIYHSLSSYQIGSGKIGNIHISLDNDAFPSDNWTDFGKTIISWWLSEFLRLHAGEAHKVQCKFMDGNYRFDLSVINGEMWQIELIKEYADRDEILQQAVINANQVTKLLLEKVQEVVNLYVEEGNSETAKNFLEIKQKLFKHWKMPH